MKYWNALKKVNYKSVLERAAWTFVQGFLAIVALASENIIDLVFRGDWLQLKALLLATVVGGVAAGLSALKTVVIDYSRKLKAL